MQSKGPSDKFTRWQRIKIAVESWYWQVRCYFTDDPEEDEAP